MSWNDSTNSQKTRNSRKRLTRKIQQLVTTDERWKAEAAQDEDSDDTLVDRTSGEILNEVLSIAQALKFQLGIDHGMAITRSKEKIEFGGTYIYMYEGKQKQGVSNSWLLDVISREVNSHVNERFTGINVRKVFRELNIIHGT